MIQTSGTMNDLFKRSGKLGRAGLVLCLVWGFGSCLVASAEEAAAPQLGALKKETEIVVPWPTTPSLAQMGRKAQSARELLRLLRVDDSLIERFVDGRSLHSDEHESLLRILYHLPRLGIHNLQRWQKGKAIPWAELETMPAIHRTESFHLEGRVRRIEQRKLSPELAERFEFDKYFLVTMEAPDRPAPFVVCALAIPSQWIFALELNERASAEGIFLKVGAGEGAETSLLFAAARVAWHPIEVNAAMGVSDDWALLARQGVDVGAFEGVAAADRAEIGYGDREAFYQVLHAVNQIEPSEWAARAKQETSVTKLLNSVPPHFGRVAAISGVARRVIRVPINDEDIRARFGMDHYFEIDLFVRLGPHEVVKLGKPSSNAEMTEESKDVRPSFRGEFPVMFYARSLPRGVEPSDDCRYPMRAVGIYLKTFAYRTEYVAKFGGSERQLSPLLLGQAPELIEAEIPSDPIGWLITAAFSGFALLILGMGLRAWLRPAKQIELSESFQGFAAELSPPSATPTEVGQGDDTSMGGPSDASAGGREASSG